MNNHNIYQGYLYVLAILALVLTNFSIFLVLFEIILFESDDKLVVLWYFGCSLSLKRNLFELVALYFHTGCPTINQVNVCQKQTAHF